MKKLFFKAITIAAVFALCGCSNKDKQTEDTTEPAVQENVSESATENVQTTDELDDESDEGQFIDLGISFKASNAGYKNKVKKPTLQLLETPQIGTEAHKIHLNDPMEFAALPTVSESEKIAIVGSSKCVLYKKTDIKTDDDLTSLEEIESIPKGAVISITGDTIKAQGKDEFYNGLFEFEKDWNWFYPVTYNGKEGIVFGADLCALDNTNEEKAILSLLYQSIDKGGSGDAYFEKFYPICGYTKLSDQIKTAISKDKIALQGVAQHEYRLSPDSPDDMVALYQNHRDSIYKESTEKDITPLFITTDFFAHAQHLLFDQVLQNIEETIMLPRLHTISKEFIQKISADLEKDPSNETAKKALEYFQVGKAMMELAPTLKEKEQPWHDDEWIEPDRDKIFSQYNKNVRKEIALIDEAGGMRDSVVFKFADGGQYKEDYSQYKPRGHYTKSEVLKAYFRSMMWFGRINFTFPDPSSNTEAGLKLANDMLRIALYITDIAANDSDLCKKWNEIFEPITVLIGECDDISLNEMVPLWKTFKVSKALEWIAKDENIKNFSEQARKTLKPPVIAGNSVFYSNQSEGNLSDPSSMNPAMGWRFLGQRFTYDAWVFNDVSSPRITRRGMVSGRDIAAAFGSNNAEVLLKDEFTTFPKLKSVLDSFEKLFNSKNKEFWCENYYTSVLASIKAQAQFEQGAGFYFTQSPLWNRKALEASLGTWAELKHDTILYAKQSYAERGGGGEDMTPTYRTEPLPTTVHYIEPNVEFFTTLCNSLSKLNLFLWEYDLFDTNSYTAISEMESIASQALKIVQLETKNERVSKEDLKWIATIPWSLARIVIPYFNYSTATDTDNTGNTDQFKMALVADVFTNAEAGKVLEVAVGMPQRIYVALNDKQGGKRIAVGYTFNYYEFEQPMSDRLNDEQWKELVYKNLNATKEKKPSWLPNDVLQHPNGFGGK